MTATNESTRISLRPSRAACLSTPTLFERALIWMHGLGIGYCPAPLIDYDASYFENYIGLDASPMGQALTEARVEMLRRHLPACFQAEVRVVDIGIGAGNFVMAADCHGFDVCEPARQWLIGDGRYLNPWQMGDETVPVLTFWDSLEHIPDPEPLLAKAAVFVLISMPIYAGEEDCRRSKHFKPGEHVWYFTQDGLIEWMKGLGFELVEMNNRETELGREGILSFAFKRVKP